MPNEGGRNGAVEIWQVCEGAMGAMEAGEVVRRHMTGGGLMCGGIMVVDAVEGATGPW